MEKLIEKIENKDERKRLKNIAKSYISGYKNEKYGIKRSCISS